MHDFALYKFPILFYSVVGHTVKTMAIHCHLLLEVLLRSVNVTEIYHVDRAKSGIHSFSV